MKGGFKNALPWTVLITIIVLSLGFSMVMVEGMKTQDKKEHLEKEPKKVKGIGDLLG